MDVRPPLEVALQAVRPSDVGLGAVEELTHISAHTGVNHHLTAWVLAEVTAQVQHVSIEEGKFPSLLNLFSELFNGHALLDLVKFE